MKITNVVIVFIILLSFLISFWFLPQMPEKMISHWDAQGKPDGYLSKYIALFLMPLVSVGLLLLFWIIPKIDPLKENIEKFRNYYDIFVLLLIIFLFYIYLLSIFYNLGWKVNMNQAIPPATGLFFYYLGVLLSKAKRNWFIGIRTPWTLRNEAVWDHTHQRGSRLFKIAGIFAFFGVFFAKWAIFFVIIPIILVAAYTIIFSYFDYQRETATQDN